MVKKYEGEGIQSSSNDVNIVKENNREWLLSDKIFSYNLQYQNIISVIIIRNNSGKQFTSEYLTIKSILREYMPKYIYLHNKLQFSCQKEWNYLKYKNYCLTANTCGFFLQITFSNCSTFLCHFSIKFLFQEREGAAAIRKGEGIIQAV